MLYKLTKGSISRIRRDLDGVNKLIHDGYELDGEVNDKFEVVNPTPSIVPDYSQMSAKELHELCDNVGLAHKGKTKAQMLEMLASGE